MNARRTKRARTCVAIIADIVHSRAITGAKRRSLQVRLNSLLERINTEYVDGILAKFLITLGDEFQGLLCRPEHIPDIVWEVERELGEIDVRFGIGLGTLDTDLQEYAIGMDGSAWHNARTAIQQAKSDNLNGGVFRGFGESNDTILNGLARLLRHLREKLRDRQWRILDQYRLDPVQAKIARDIDIDRQTVHRNIKSTGAAAYLEGERALRLVLQKFDTRDDWAAP